LKPSSEKDKNQQRILNKSEKGKLKKEESLGAQEPSEIVS
jgi:hypothetical protein